MNTETDLHIVIGLGVTGYSVASYLAGKGWPVLVMDTRDSPPNAEKLAATHPDIPVRTGPFDLALLQAAKRVIVSPGVSVHTGVLGEFVTGGGSVCGDIQLFAEAARGQVIGITGSNGKSTVTTLVAELLKAAGKRIAVGGNLGTPALDLLTDNIDYYVLELSSFQLETVYSLHLVAATILNISEDHMDRYNSLSDYVAAKQGIYQGAALCLYNRDDRLTFPPKTDASISFGQGMPSSLNDYGLKRTGRDTFLMKGERPVLNTRELTIAGQHNWMNALAALAMVEAVGVSIDTVLPTLKSFPGLPHRCQFVKAVRGVSWFNDSKATNVGACVAAIEGLSQNCENKIILLAGGQGKDADFSPLTAVLKAHVREVILFGEDANKIAAVLDEENIPLSASTLQEAVQLANRYAQPGDMVLLAPACASFDMFQNYVDRGEQFCRLVEAITE